MNEMVSTNQNKQFKRLELRGKAIAYIDWANVYGWRKSLKQEIDPEKLYYYLKSYQEISDIRLYFGEDTHPKSKQFLDDARKIGYTVVTKPVKYILVEEAKQEKIYRRKCDFDMEVCIDTHRALAEKLESFVFLTGDGDYEPLYKMLIRLSKQVIVIYAHGHLGREIYQIHKGLYKKSIDSVDNIFIT